MTGRLHSPALSILDVALAVGFAGPAALSSAFRRWTGLSPREWRSRPVMASVGAGWCRTRSDGDLRTPVSPPVRGYESGGSDSHPTPSHPGFALARTILQVELTRLGPCLDHTFRPCSKLKEVPVYPPVALLQVLDGADTPVSLQRSNRSMRW
jgi:hypothetical protein